MQLTEQEQPITEAPRKWGVLHRFPFERIHPVWVGEDEALECAALVYAGKAEFQAWWNKRQAWKAEKARRIKAWGRAHTRQKWLDRHERNDDDD